MSTHRRSRSRSTTAPSRWLGFSPPPQSLVREERETNAQTLDYDRNRAELSFVRQF